MAIYYKVYQCNRKGSPAKGKWYGRAAMIDTDTTNDLTKGIQEKCTVNEADVLAVINALISEMTRSLQSSHRVKLPGFGTFKLGISSKPADERDKFGVSNIKNVHVIFTPELKKGQSGANTRTFVNGARLKAFSSLETNNAGAATGGDAGNGNADNPGTSDNPGTGDNAGGSGNTGGSGDNAGTDA